MRLVKGLLHIPRLHAMYGNVSIFLYIWRMMIMPYILLNVTLARWSLQCSFFLHIKIGCISLFFAIWIEMLPMPVCFINFFRYKIHVRYTVLWESELQRHHNSRTAPISVTPREGDPLTQVTPRENDPLLICGGESKQTYIVTRSGDRSSGDVFSYMKLNYKKKKNLCMCRPINPPYLMCSNDQIFWKDLRNW